MGSGGAKLGGRGRGAGSREAGSCPPGCASAGGSIAVGGLTEEGQQLTRFALLPRPGGKPPPPLAGGLCKWD